MIIKTYKLRLRTESEELRLEVLVPLAEANEHLSSELHLMDVAATRDFVDTILSLWERKLNKRYM